MLALKQTRLAVCNVRERLRGLSRIIFNYVMTKYVGRDSSVGIATRYRLDGPGIEFRLGRYFSHPPRLALGPTQPPVQWVPGLS